MSPEDGQCFLTLLFGYSGIWIAVYVMGFENGGMQETLSWVVIDYDISDFRQVYSMLFRPKQQCFRFVDIGVGWKVSCISVTKQFPEFGELIAED